MMSDPSAPPITAIVVCRNEADHLRQCLPTLRWCEELIVVDLQSHDDSPVVAAEYADRVLRHPPSPIVEPVRCFAARHASYDWLLIVDPDERLSPALPDAIRQCIVSGRTIGAVRVPWRFHFKGEALTGTIWGKPNHSKRIVVHRRRCALQPINHRTSRLLEGFEEATVESAGDNDLVHDWSRSYIDLAAKHWRYAAWEGEALYASGHRFGVGMVTRRPLRELTRSLIDDRGWRCGVRGIILSTIYGLYIWACGWSLLMHQMRRARTTPGDQDLRSDMDGQERTAA